MTYIKVSKEQANEIMQPIYKYMPTFVQHNGEMVQVIAQENGKIYYIGD